MLTQNVIEQIKAHAKAEYPKEACGIAVQTDIGVIYVACQNTAEDPEEEFRIDPADYAACEDVGTIIYIVHSHPDAAARPSPFDMAVCDASLIPWVICSYPEGDICYLEPSKEVRPLKGRPFIAGYWDCYTIIRDYYKLHKNIEIPNFIRVGEWWNDGQNLYAENYEKAGFYAHEGPLKEGDVVLMQINSPVINHGGVINEDGYMLHHMLGHISGQTVYGGYWRERTILKLRHKDLS